jgi:hypothetical protein
VEHSRVDASVAPGVDLEGRARARPHHHRRRWWTDQPARKASHDPACRVQARRVHFSSQPHQQAAKVSLQRVAFQERLFTDRNGLRGFPANYRYYHEVGE